jgi:transcriptional regulator with XRE-family HTH domain
MTDTATILRERISRARRDAGLAQATIEKGLKLTAGAFSKIESGARDITSTELAAFAQMCGLNVGWFFDAEPTSVPMLRGDSASGLGRADLAWLHEFAEATVSLERLVGNKGKGVQGNGKTRAR